jgi:hypothetical protein
MSSRSFLLATFAALLLPSFSARAMEIDADEQGSISKFYIISPIGPVSSMVETGGMSGFSFLPVSYIDSRNFASFDLSGFSAGGIQNADIQFTVDSSVISPPGAYQHELAELDLYYNSATNSPATDVSQYANLQSGDKIGSAQVPVFISAGSTIQVDLNALGIEDLNEAAGGSFIVGGDIYAVGCMSPDTLEFDLSDAALNLDPGNGVNLDPIAVPEPAAWKLFLMGGASLLFAKRFGPRARMTGLVAKWQTRQI